MRPMNPAVVACPPSGIRRFFDIAASMEDVISLGVGEPDYATPWRIREAGIYALESGITTSTSNAGLLELREAICADLDRRAVSKTFDQGMDQLLLQPMRRLNIGKHFRPSIDTANRCPMQMTQLSESGARGSPPRGWLDNELGSVQGADILGEVFAR